MTYKITYFFYFFFFGLFFNLVPGRFYDLNFSGFQIASIFVLIPLVAFFANIFWGKLADQYRCRRKLLLIFSVFSAISLVIIFLADSFPAYLLLALLMGSIIYPMIALNDSLTISYSNQVNIAYGVFRQWGTISFIMANLFLTIAYMILSKFQISPYFLLFIMPVAFIFMGFSINKTVEFEVKKDKILFRDIIDCCKQKIFILFLFSVIFHNIAYVSMYSYFTPHLKGLGFSGTFISLCWAISPIGEILIFRYSGIILQYCNAYKLFKIALIAGALRWFFLGFFEDKFVVASSQIIHSVSFGAYYVASINILTKIVPEKLRSSGQGIFGASISLAMIIGNLTMGLIYQYSSTFVIFRFAFIISIVASFVSLFLYSDKIVDKDSHSLHGD